MSTCSVWVDKGVIECKQWGYELERRCRDWAAQQREECAQWADEGYSRCDDWETTWERRCDDWDKDCCDWWPCSWACDVITWICQGWTWVSSQVCRAWVWVANWVCKAWYTILEWVCVAFVWVLKVVCVVWSWVAKLVCIAWDTIRCLLVKLGGILAKVGRLFTKRRVPRIRHVFVLMLENRSFDHMLGFADLRGTDAITGLPTSANGLVGNPHSNLDPATNVAVPAAPPADFALSAADKDPSHEFDDALKQLCGQNASYPPSRQYPPISNSGFVANLRSHGSASPGKAMSMYSPEQVPVITALAREFAVCDGWFSSLPGPTWPNRFFVHAASSAGLDDSPSGFDVLTSTLIDGYRFDNGTIYDRLEDKCLNWLVFEGDETPQVFALSNMTFNALQGRFRDFEDFRDSVNDRNFPASYTFIEPNYGNILPWTPEDFTCGNSQHPLDDITRGERLIKDVYEAVRNSPHWNDSLIVVTYDEHGGFYDHAAPGPTVHPGDSITDNDNNHNNFAFDQLGVRVPTVVISPYIPRGIIDHTVYDHSSVIKTVARLFGFSTLTERDRLANSFEHLLSLSTPRTDAPVQLPPPAVSGFRCTGDADPYRSRVSAAARGLMEPRPGDPQGGQRVPPPADLQTEDALRPPDPKFNGFLHVALRRQLSLADPSQREEIIEQYRRIRTNADAKHFIAQAREYVRAYKLTHPRKKPWLYGRGKSRSRSSPGQ